MGGGGSKKNAITVGARECSIERVLGKGAFGKVHCLIVMNKQQILDKGAHCARNTVRERVLLSKLNNLFIVNLWGSLQDDQNLYLIMDMMIGGELAFYLHQKNKGLEEKLVQFYSANLCLGLEYLHAHHVIHRDIKPENILLDERGYAKLTDFNVAVEVAEEPHQTTGFCGTRPYIAPEVYRKEPYSVEVDMWSLGILLYQLLFGILPWASKQCEETVKWLDEFEDKMGDVEIQEGKGGEVNEMTKRILREKTKIPKGKTSNECVLFLKGLICTREKRMDTSYALGHEWLKKSVDIEKLRKGELEAPIKPRLDQANIDKNMGLVEFMMDEEAKGQKKVPLTAEQQAQFDEWNWLCDELRVEEEKLKAEGGEGSGSGGKDKKGKKRKKSTKAGKAPEGED